MNTRETKQVVQANRVATIKADKGNLTVGPPEIDELLKELGGEDATLPFLAIYPSDGSQPILMRGAITQQQVLDALQRAGPSKAAPTVSTAAKR